MANPLGFSHFVASLSIQHDFRIRAVASILANQKIIFIAYDAIAPVTAANLNLIAQIYFVVLQQLYRQAIWKLIFQIHIATTEKVEIFHM